MAIPAEKALDLLRVARAHATEAHAAVTAVVVDEGGLVIALSRMDEARPVTVDLATNRAYTAATFRRPTQELAADAAKSWFQSLIVSSAGRVMAGAGAVPLFEGGRCVGAVAVAGGTDEVDQRCCEAAAATFG